MLLPSRICLLGVAVVSVVIFHLQPTPIESVGIDEEADVPIKRLNAGMSMKVGIPIEEALERLRSMPHRRNALIRSLGATSLTQRAGRNLIFRVLLTIGHQNHLTECIARVMCEQMCQDEVAKVAKNYFDTYPTDDVYVTYVLKAGEKGRDLGASYHCDTCNLLYPLCKGHGVHQQVLTKYKYLMEVTNYVLEKIPS